MRKVVEQGIWRFPRFTPVEVARIVFYAWTYPNLADKRDVVVGTALQTLGFQHFAGTLKYSQAFFKLMFNISIALSRSSFGVT
jgi:hypothetical protein